VIVIVSMAFVLDPNNAPVAYRPPSLLGTSAVTNPADHLELRLTLNATSIRSGQAVNISISEFNPQPQPNNVTASDDWPIEGLSLGPCGTINLPIGLELFSGYYDASNVSSARALQLDSPGIYNCPMMMSVDSYSFHPSSSAADVYGSCTPGFCFTMDVSSASSVSGYWGSGSSQAGNFHRLSPGTYTVAAGDEWGALTILHFVVG
jgi:hypothetical protein